MDPNPERNLKATLEETPEYNLKHALDITIKRNPRGYHRGTLEEHRKLHKQERTQISHSTNRTHFTNIQPVFALDLSPGYAQG